MRANAIDPASLAELFRRMRDRGPFGDDKPDETSVRRCRSEGGEIDEAGGPVLDSRVPEHASRHRTPDRPIRQGALTLSAGDGVCARQVNAGGWVDRLRGQHLRLEAVRQCFRHQQCDRELAGASSALNAIATLRSEPKNRGTWLSKPITSSPSDTNERSPAQVRSGRRMVNVVAVCGRSMPIAMSISLKASRRAARCHPRSPESLAATGIRQVPAFVDADYCRPCREHQRRPVP